MELAGSSFQSLALLVRKTNLTSLFTVRTRVVLINILLGQLSLCLALSLSCSLARAFALSVYLSLARCSPTAAAALKPPPGAGVVEKAERFHLLRHVGPHHLVLLIPGPTCMRKARTRGRKSTPTANNALSAGECLSITEVTPPRTLTRQRPTQRTTCTAHAPPHVVRCVGR
jgi:hypothetical protein